MALAFLHPCFYIVTFSFKVIGIISISIYFEAADENGTQAGRLVGTRPSLMSRDRYKGFLGTSGNVYVLCSNRNTEESIYHAAVRAKPPISCTFRCLPRKEAQLTAEQASGARPATALPRALLSATTADGENCAERISNARIKNVAHFTIPCQLS